MSTLFEWLDAHPQLYWQLALASTVALTGWIAAGLRAAARERKLPLADWIFAPLLLVFLLAWRWPYFFCAAEYNPDESQFVAGAMALARDPVFWRSVDGVTSGPLDFYALLPLHWLGLPLDYFGARITAVVLTWGTLLLLYRTFRRYGEPAVAQVAVLPAATFFAAASAPDFVHYSSELTPLALLALALVWIEHRPRTSAFVAGFLPWAKLQAGPLAAVLVGWQLWQAWRESAPGRRPWRRLAALVGTAAVPTILVVGLVAAFGQWEHFYRRFFLQNVAYVTGGQPADLVLRDLLRFAQESGHFFPWLAATLVLLAAAGILLFRQRADLPPQLLRDLSTHARTKGFAVAWIAEALLFLLGGGVVHVDRREPPPRLVGLAMALTAAALVCIATPARSSLHYLFFLTVPLSLWSGVLFCDLWSRGSARFLLGGLALVCALVPVGVRLSQPPPDMAGQFADHWRQPFSPIGQVLRHWQPAGARLALWGWMSYAYVEGGLPQATRDTVSQWCILPVAQRDYYRATFLADMERNQPEVFVDAVGPGAPFFFQRPSQAHEIYPELADYVRQHYSLVIDLQQARIYARTDFLARHPLATSELQRLVGRGRRDYGFPVRPASTTPATLPVDRVSGRQVQMILPPAEMLWPLRGTERSFRVNFGIHPRAYTEGATDGAEFIVELRMPGQPPLQVFHRLLDPERQPSDRLPLSGQVDLPPYPPGSELAVRTTAGKADNSAWDWVYFEALRFAHSPFYSARQFPGFRRVPDELQVAYPYLVRRDPDWVLMLPPPATLGFLLDGDERQLNFSFGLAEGAYTPPGQTDGATFSVELQRAGSAPRNLYSRRLDPLGRIADRGRQSADLLLPADVRLGDRIVIRIDPGASTSWDWTYISALDLR